MTSPLAGFGTAALLADTDFDTDNLHRKGLMLIEQTAKAEGDSFTTMSR